MVEWIPKVRLQADSVDRETSHNPGVIKVGGRFTMGRHGVPKPMQYPLGHSDCKTVRAVWRAGPAS